MLTTAEKRDLGAAGLAQGFHRLQATDRGPKRRKPYHVSSHVYDPIIADGDRGYSFQGGVGCLDTEVRSGRYAKAKEVYAGGGMLGAVLVEWRSIGRGIGVNQPQPTQLQVYGRVRELLRRVEPLLAATAHEPRAALKAALGFLCAERGLAPPHLQLELRPLLQLILDLCADEVVASEAARLLKGVTIDPATSCRAAAAFFEGVPLRDVAQSRLTDACRADEPNRLLFVPFLSHEHPGYPRQASTNSWCAMFIAEVLRFVGLPARLAAGDASLCARLCAQSGRLARELWLSSLSEQERAKHEPEKLEDALLAIKLFNAFRFLATRARTAHHTAPYAAANDDEVDWHKNLSCTRRDAAECHHPTQMDLNFRQGGGVIGSLIEAWCRMHVADRRLLREGLDGEPGGEWLSLSRLTAEGSLAFLETVLRAVAADTFSTAGQPIPAAQAETLLARCDPLLLNQQIPDCWPLIHLLLALRGDADVVAHLLGCLGTQSHALARRTRALAIATATYFAGDEDERAKFSPLVKYCGSAIRDLSASTRTLHALVTAAGGVDVVGPFLALCIEFLCAPGVEALSGSTGGACDCSAALLALAHNHAVRPFAGEAPLTREVAPLLRLPNEPELLLVCETHLTPKATWAPTSRSAEPWPTKAAVQADRAEEASRAALAHSCVLFDLRSALQLAVKAGPLTSPFLAQSKKPLLVDAATGKQMRPKYRAADAATVRAMEARVATAVVALTSTCARQMEWASLVQRWLDLSRGPMERCGAALRFRLHEFPAQRHAVPMWAAIAKHTRALLVSTTHPQGASCAATATATATAARDLSVHVSLLASRVIEHYHSADQLIHAQRAERHAHAFLHGLAKELGVDVRLVLTQPAERCLRPPSPPSPTPPTPRPADASPSSTPPSDPPTNAVPPETQALMAELRAEQAQKADDDANWRRGARARV